AGAAGDGDCGGAAGTDHEVIPRKGSSVGAAAAGGVGGSGGDDPSETKAVVGHEVFGVTRGTERVRERSGVENLDGIGGGAGGVEDGGGDAAGDRTAGNTPYQYHLGVGGGDGGSGSGVEALPSPPLERDTGWGWHGVSTTDEEHGTEGQDAFS
ncbi:unnamed protein product, partial [Scytosiphon promiscuus]